MIPADLHDAEGWLAAGRAAEALMAAETALAQGRGEAAGLRDRALAAIQAMEPAFASLQLAAAVHADRPQSHLDLGHAYLLGEQIGDAARCFAQALALDPASADASASLALVQFRMGDHAAAERHSRQALALDETQIVASQTLGSILEARGEMEAARAVQARAYARQSLFVQAADNSRMRVLVLATAGSGNIPYKTIMPPTLYSRLIWYMDYAREAETPPADAYDVVFNVIGDADMALPSQPAVTRFLAATAKSVLNDPDRVMLTRRDRTPDVLGGMRDVVAPRTVRLDAAAIAARGLAALAVDHDLAEPVLVRPIGSHGGEGLRLAAGPGGLAAMEAAPGQDHYLTAYRDYRSADGLYRKYRVIYVDRQPFPYHLAISGDWLVHHETSGMDAFADRREEEARFLADPAAAIGPRALEAVRQIGLALDLDYAGMDFAVLPDERLLVFEANATMLVHREDPEGPYAHKNRFIEAIIDAFQSLLLRQLG